MNIDRTSFQALLDAASEANSPHVDLGPMLGTSFPVRVGVDDIAQALLAHDFPNFSVDLGRNGEIKVSHIDGGALVTWSGVF